MKLKHLILLTLILSSITTFSQDIEFDSHEVTIQIPNVALLDLESSSGIDITLSGTAPTEAGDAVNFNTTNSSIWINYSSIADSNYNASRNITVKITDGDVPKGLELTVIASDDSGKGKGKMGNPENYAIALSEMKEEIIIDGIGSSYTGNGPNNGHQLTYTLLQSSDTDSYEDLDFDQSDTVTITYTLSDD
jgi:hypothetical protein